MKTDFQDRYDQPIAMIPPLEKLRASVHAIHGLTLLRGVLAHAAGQAVLQLLQALTSQPDPIVTAEAFSNAFSQLATAAYTDPEPVVADAWQAYLVSSLIEDRNLWSTQVEQVGSPRLSPALRMQAQRDLQTLQRLFDLDAHLLWAQTCAAVTSAMPELGDAWSPWSDLQPQREPTPNTARTALAQTIATCTDWKELVSPLEQYWSRYGTGKLARYHVLRWQDNQQQLSGIAYPDPIQLTGLIGHERQQSLIKANIEHFMAGLPAHDMLLYGPPGTGKSSTIKAITNAYTAQGLHLVEIAKEDINALPLVAAELRGHAPHYLLYIDDLSFEEHETSYKKLKVLLEGTAEARPKNVLICVTSNRMNLIRENYSDRGKPIDDINWRDTMDEKQSLVHRFGLRVNFFSPDQKQYLHIVSELAQQRGIQIAEEELQGKALAWERQHAGRSGRSARQFIDDLEAEWKLEQA
ncbi:ATP-binding protein [Dictyobacter arantiisoli]|uniref:Uncharacterized protein n=1 Tax=Dictyobacter arantiisoli TaxID=2014874 RepID=A0A5A5TKG6_9CHLR|nr:ATP-binding protein [Dictyobacter arantiisoli]GCF11728.1 hypothetical protein KDI_52920 [Dictyobacter arantiisoli]